MRRASQSILLDFMNVPLGLLRCVFANAFVHVLLSQKHYENLRSVRKPRIAIYMQCQLMQMLRLIVRSL